MSASLKLPHGLEPEREFPAQSYPDNIPLWTENYCLSPTTPAAKWDCGRIWAALLSIPRCGVSFPSCTCPTATGWSTRVMAAARHRTAPGERPWPSNVSSRSGSGE